MATQHTASEKVINEHKRDRNAFNCMARNRTYIFF